MQIHYLQDLIDAVYALSESRIKLIREGIRPAERATFIDRLDANIRILERYTGMLFHEEFETEEQTRYINRLKEHMEKARPGLREWDWDNFVLWVIVHHDEFDRFGTTLVQISAGLSCLKAEIAKSTAA